jgi:hypothetical protein
MHFTKFFTKVTPFSKFLAAILFIMLPFLGFYLGYIYGKKTNPPINNIYYDKSDTDFPVITYPVNPTKTPNISNTPVSSDSSHTSEIYNVENKSFYPLSDTETQNWKIYSNKNVGFSLKYPAYILLMDENRYGSDIPTVTSSLLIIYIKEMNDAEKFDYNVTYGYRLEDAKKDQQYLKENKYYGNFDFVHPASRVIYKINDNNFKSHMVLGRFDTCDVTFERWLTFYKNNYQINILLSGPKNNIMNSMPDYFRDGCWKTTDNDTYSPHDSFYQAITTNKGSSQVQGWMNDFEKIINTILL